ncbi:8719_t:CDS:2, partial [Acaulospora morrowiae]
MTWALGNFTLPAENELNFVEKAWAGWFSYFDNEVVATALISFIMHEITYFGRCVPFWIADFIPAFKKYKLQPVRLSRAMEMFEISFSGAFSNRAASHFHVPSDCYFVWYGYNHCAVPQLESNSIP